MLYDGAMSDAGETSNPRMVLRLATVDDLGSILKLVRDLGEDEMKPDGIAVDEDRFHRTLFGDRPAAEVVIASYDGEPAGFALFSPTFSTRLGRPGLFVDDLFVISKLRGRGIGRALLAFLARVAVERGCGRLEWSVPDSNGPAIRFYERLGARAMDEWTVYRLAGDALEELAALSI